MIKSIFHRAEFLNKEGHCEDASILAAIACDEWSDKHKTYYCSLKIRDCKDRVSFKIKIDDQFEYDNTLHKLKVLREVITDFENFIINQGVTPDKR